MNNTITVSQLNTYVKSLIENDARLAYINLSGEISNFKNHFSSGHWYFTLKDKNASVRCVMFRSSAAHVKFNVEDGLAVVISGRVSLYEKDGQYQFYAEQMHPFGEGDLTLAFKQVKEKLEKEGLFSPESKRPIPKYPRRIAVVTSDTGAAVKDILNITAKRYSACEIVMCPVLVQGDAAAGDMIKTLDRVYALNGIDTVIIGRGGGSAEDLHCFNDEDLARKIYESPFPVISADGHETDFTICDFVADVRASTPSHAAELAVPDMYELKNRVNVLRNLLKSKIELKYNSFNSQLKVFKNRLSVANAQRIFQNRQLELDRTVDRLADRVNQKLQICKSAAARLATRIDALSPLKVMARGFSVVTKDGACVASVSNLNTGDNISVSMCDGNANCIVTSIDKNKQ